MAASRANRLRLCWRPTQQRLTDRLQRYEQLDYTYVEVGATCAASLPAGYHHIDHSTIAGTGHKTFALLAKALWGWQLQRCAGLVVATSHDTVTIGVTVLNAIPDRPGLVAPCRVVDVVDDHRRRGFSYGTLPGHPLRGEERFTVEFDAAGRVVLHIVSFSVPTGLARLAPPVARLGQRALNGRYAAAACRIVAPPGRPLPAPPTHDRLTITRHGQPVAVVLSPDDLASMEETLAILAVPGGAGGHPGGRSRARYRTRGKLGGTSGGIQPIALRGC